MSILLIGLPDGPDRSTIERLRDQGDEVRILGPGGRRADAWRAEGVHVAEGSPDDDDLVERAATNCRSVVVGEEAFDHLGSIVTGLERRVQPRVIVCGSSIPDTANQVLRATSLESILLVTGRRGLLRKSGVEDDRLAEAIDAADDIAEVPGIPVDLRTTEGWSLLRLAPPG